MWAMSRSQRKTRWIGRGSGLEVAGSQAEANALQHGFPSSPQRPLLMETSKALAQADLDLGQS